MTVSRENKGNLTCWRYRTHQVIWDEDSYILQSVPSHELHVAFVPRCMVTLLDLVLRSLVGNDIQAATIQVVDGTLCPWHSCVRAYCSQFSYLGQRSSSNIVDEVTIEASNHFRLRHESWHCPLHTPYFDITTQQRPIILQVGSCQVGLQFPQQASLMLWWSKVWCNAWGRSKGAEANPLGRARNRCRVLKYSTLYLSNSKIYMYMPFFDLANRLRAIKVQLALHDNMSGMPNSLVRAWRLARHDNVTKSSTHMTVKNSLCKCLL